MNALVSATDALLDLVLPVHCVGCHAPMGGERGVACGRCLSRLARLPAPHCGRCGHPIDHRDSACRYCVLFPNIVERVRSYCWAPDPIASPLLAALKYADWPRAGEALGKVMLRADGSGALRRDLAAVVPVPLDPVRQRERGYNQARVLAQVVATAWGVPLRDDLLTRVRHTVTQTRLTPQDRLANVSGAFAVTAGAQAFVRGRPLLLIDDVLTTGATLNACAQALAEAGAAGVRYLTFARARDASRRPL
ncbi:MAG: double zinc ribbon domain-containing protein [Gemmatimonadaceae bacterium]|nr:double zinc ribbon domain-containing protein [Gemmatimonadaceae bacterium]